MVFIEADQIVGTTFYTIDRLSQEKNGGDALILYFKYIKQSRIQKTNQSRSLDSFMMEGLPRGKDRFVNAKALLKKLGLIEVIQIRNQLGKIETYYVKTNFIIDETKVKQYTIDYIVDKQETGIVNNLTLDFPVSGETDTNALSTKHKCLKNLKENTGTSKNKKESANPTINSDLTFDKFWTLYPNKKGKAKSKELRGKIKEDLHSIIMNAVRIYAVECKGKESTYIKHGSTRLGGKYWEDYEPLKQEDLFIEMKKTRHEEDKTGYGQNMKSKYELLENGYELRQEDKSKIKQERKEYRLSHNGKNPIWQ